MGWGKRGQNLADAFFVKEKRPLAILSTFQHFHPHWIKVLFCIWKEPGIMHLKLDYHHPAGFQVFPTKAFTSVPSFASSSFSFLSQLSFWGPFSPLNYSLGKHLPCSRIAQMDNLLLIVLMNHWLLLSPSQWLTASITASIQHLQPRLSLFLLSPKCDSLLVLHLEETIASLGQRPNQRHCDYGCQ